MFDAAGELLALEGFITDISDRRREEDRLRERELLLDTIFEASSNALLLTDPQGVVTLVNAAARRLFALDGQVGSASLAHVVRRHRSVLRWRTPPQVPAPAAR